MTTADQIAAKYNDDGSCFEVDGHQITHDCDLTAAEKHVGEDRELYIFEDGSAIFITDGGWDTVTSSDGGDTWDSNGWGVVAHIDAYGNINWNFQE